MIWPFGRRARLARMLQRQHIAEMDVTLAQHDRDLKLIKARQEELRDHLTELRVDMGLTVRED